MVSPARPPTSKSLSSPWRCAPTPASLCSRRCWRNTAWLSACHRRRPSWWRSSTGWQISRTLCGGIELSDDLKSSPLSAAHAGAGFAADRIFCVARQYPWKDAIGDMRANVEELKRQTDAPPESTTSKICSLLQMECNRDQLHYAAALFKDTSWSSTSDEQQHGSAATVLKARKRYSRRRVMCRSFIHMMRQFFNVSDTDKAREALERACRFVAVE